MSRVRVATLLELRQQARRPLLIVLLVGLPFFFITRAIAQTEKVPRLVGLPGGGEVLTTMRDVHGANMAAITVAFLAGLAGVFTVHSARQADRRLVVAGFHPWEAITPRLLVLGAATALVTASSLLVTGLSFTPAQWPAFVVGNLLVGLIYGMLGALAGAAVGRLGATYLILIGAMLDIGIVQNPMFGSGEPPAWGAALPGYGPGRIVIGAAFSEQLDAWGPVALALAWTLALGLALAVVLGRLVGVRAGPVTNP